MTKVCRAKPKYKKWTPVTGDDGYMLPPPRTVKKEPRFKQPRYTPSFKQGDTVVRTGDSTIVMTKGARYTVKEVEGFCVRLVGYYGLYNAQLFKPLVKVRP